MTKTRDLKAVLPLVEDLKTRAGNLFNNVKLRRVTHTLNSLKLVIRAATQVQFEMQDGTAFVRKLSNALYQSQQGAIEIQPYDDGTIFIRGAFHVDQLRIYLLVNQPLDTIELDVGGPDETA